MIEYLDKNYWLNDLCNTSTIIDENIKLIDNNNYQLIASNILSHLRDFVDSFSSFIFLMENRDYNVITEKWKIIQDSYKFCKSHDIYNFISEFHDCLNSSVSHFTLSGEYAERMLLKYLDYLANSKITLKNKFNIDIFKNLTKLPIDMDNELANYYAEILNKLTINTFKTSNSESKVYYVQKKKTIYINNKVIYEYTLSNAQDKLSKLDRFIAYSKINIFTNYAIKCSFIEDKISIFNKSINILIINDYFVSIRPCEFSNYDYIFFGKFDNNYNRTKQYYNLMNYIKNNNKSLADIVLFNDEDFTRFLEKIKDKIEKDTNIINFLKRNHDYIKSNKIGKNTLLYLLSIMKNTVIKNQIQNSENNQINQLCLKLGTLIFENTPLSASLIKHNPDFSILLKLFNAEEREDELLAREINKNSNNNSLIYFDAKSLSLSDKEINTLILKYNSRLSERQQDRRIERHGNNLYINSNEDNTIFIIETLLNKRSKFKNGEYTHFAKKNLDKSKMDDPQKIDAIYKMFSNNGFFCIYGSAGTGKSTLISHELSILKNYSKLCLANTHPAVQNMKRKINDNDAEYMTISSFLYSKSVKTDWDILVIDECSNVSTNDMAKILDKVNTDLILLSGDIFQLSSIQFGNWFSLLKNFISKDSYIDLNNTYRSDNNTLLNLWNKVRNISHKIQEDLTSFRISHKISDDIFNKKSDDEIILCLNYDGLYGINNLNKLLQLSNPNQEYKWDQYTFKVNDPIVFNESNRFGNILYNNLKGTIKKINVTNYSIRFQLEVNTFIEQEKDNIFADDDRGFVVLKNISNEKTLIELSVTKSYEEDYDKDTEEEAIVPFQIAYAVSIHKSQGLEYDSVKLVITNEIGESITHNVFYTAITRAKKILNIYWSPECEKEVISSLSIKDYNSDVNILSNNSNLNIKS